MTARPANSKGSPRREFPWCATTGINRKRRILSFLVCSDVGGAGAGKGNDRERAGKTSRAAGQAAGRGL